MQLSHSEHDIWFSAPEVVGQSYYLGITTPEVHMGDILLRSGKRWKKIGNLADIALVRNVKRRAMMRNILKDVNQSAQVPIKLNGGATLTYKFISNTGTTIKDISDLPENFEGKTQINVHLKNESAYDINGTGSWETLRRGVELEDAIKSIDKTEALYALCHDFTAVYAVVTEMFRTAGVFTAFTSQNDVKNFTFEAEIKVEAPIANILGKLQRQVQENISGSELVLSADGNPRVPFVRLRRLRPRWWIAGRLELRPGDQVAGFSLADNEKLLPDTLELDNLEPDEL